MEKVWFFFCYGKKKMEDYINDGIKNETIKLCPFCGIPSELASGCNYVTCFCKRGFNEKSEWCWVCKLPKFQPDPVADSNGACNDQSHNSHS